MFINEIVWMFSSASSNTHNDILWYSKGKIKIKNTVKIPFMHNNNGTYRYWLKKSGLDEANKKLDDGRDCKNTWIDIPSNTTCHSNNIYPTGKPFKLLERIICLSTKESDAIIS